MLFDCREGARAIDLVVDAPLDTVRVPAGDGETTQRGANVTIGTPIR
jgi:hypothetical protein